MATTARGHIEQLPSGSFRVHVYAGTDPVTGKPRRLKLPGPHWILAFIELGSGALVVIRAPAVAVVGSGVGYFG